MPENPQPTKRTLTPDWFVQGILTKVGDIFDRLTGRGWKPSSSLATSELIEKLKALLEAEKRVVEGREYVPHRVKLKMQWDKFSTDSEQALGKLENEMLTAMVDFINDNRYYTYAPIHIEAKPDYFTKGVKLLLSFDETQEEREADIHVSDAPTATETSLPPSTSLAVRFHFRSGGQEVDKEIRFDPGVRVSVGRTKENGLSVDDPSVSKVHAAITLNSERRLMVADTGSTNGTFVNGARIPYGKASQVEPGTELMFGVVKIEIEFLERPQDFVEPEDTGQTASYRVGEFEFTQRSEPPEAPNGTSSSEPAPTQAAIEIPSGEDGLKK